ncbi:MAG: 50S ribosomal protein L25 [Elusimicrobiota bacterium]|jgi:large subunit ribosomal protein L25|nr:50S ribosomal protein L25 [Elusimicrobiota bacterium]
MEEILLDVRPREVLSKGGLAKERKAGNVPAVFYGKDLKPELLFVNTKRILSIIETKGANALIMLDFKSGKKSALIKEISRDIISQQPIHIDFQYVSLTETIEVSIPIQIEGVASGVKNFGGVMEFIVREVKVACLPTNIPQSITIDVSPLLIGDAVTIERLPQIKDVQYLQDPQTLIVHIVNVTAEEAPTEETASAEPEVISKGKKDKEEGEAAGGAAPQANEKK